MRPGYIQQPGPAAQERIVAVEGRGRALRLTLPAGQRLVDAVAEAFAKAGFRGGTVKVDGLALAPFAYVMPALSKTGENAAFYSDTYRPEGVTRIETGAMSFGRRDGAPFFHCHALWNEASGKRNGGHILPDETYVGETITLDAFGVEGGIFEANLDPETNFKLFGPVTDAATGAGETPCVVLRLRPNQDFHGALERACGERGWSAAVIHGGVGSTICSSFDDGRETPNFATEVYIKSGAVRRDAQGGLVAHLDVGLVDYKGVMEEGVMKRGDNPVLMTFELVMAQA